MVRQISNPVCARHSVSRCRPYSDCHSYGVPSFIRTLATRSRARIDDRRKTLNVDGLRWPQIAEAKIISVLGFHLRDFFSNMGWSNFGGSPAQSRMAPSM